MVEIPNFDDRVLLDILCKLIKEKSENPIYTEEAIAKCIQNILAQYKIPSKLSWAAEGRPNILARIKGNRPGPTLLFNGHLDVVPVGNDWSVDPYACIIKDGKLFGRGAADMKSGVSAMLYATILLNQKKDFSGEILLVFNVDEERVNLGMRHLLKENCIAADYAVIAEPSELNICIAHKGVSRYRIWTTGIPGHAAYVKNPRNAIEAMSKVLPRLITLGNCVRKKQDALLGNASLTVTKIDGGSAINIIPTQCVIEIDRRVLPGETQESALNEIQTSLKDIDIDVRIDNYLFIAASCIKSDHPLVKKLSAAVKQVTNQQAQIKVFEATCEAPFLSVEKGIPTLIFGPGSLKQAHAKDEFVEIQQVISAAKIFYELALQIND